MGRAMEIRTVDLPPERAFALWTDLVRWPAFVEGFGHAEEADGWPAEGTKLVWRSVPGGRGTVTERVVESRPGERLVTEVFEERLAGRQTVAFEPAEEGSKVTIELAYKLVEAGPLGGLTDVLFVRRAQRDSLARTLRRFGAEAAEEAEL